MTEGHSEHESSTHQQGTSMEELTTIASFRGRLRICSLSERPANSTGWSLALVLKAMKVSHSVSFVNGSLTVLHIWTYRPCSVRDFHLSFQHNFAIILVSAKGEKWIIETLSFNGNTNKWEVISLKFWSSRIILSFDKKKFGESIKYYYSARMH